MINNKFVLLLTACIKPSDIVISKQSILRVDEKIRLNDYKTALKFWLNYYEPQIVGIVFVENSGYDLSELKNCLSENRFKRKVEFLHFTASEIPKGYHYGYSELEIIDYALDNSSLIKETNYFIKVTGRLYFAKLNKLIESIPNDCLFISDSRDFEIFGIKKQYIITHLFISEKSFYQNHLYGSKNVMAQFGETLMETLFFQILKPIYLQNINIILRFPFIMNPIGVGAHWNKNYSSNKNHLISFFRLILRKIAPNVWI